MRISEKRRQRILETVGNPEVADLAADLGECREWIRKTVSSQRTEQIDYAGGRALVEEKPERLSDAVVDACERHPASVGAETIFSLAREVKAVRDLENEWALSTPEPFDGHRWLSKLKKAIGKG